MLDIEDRSRETGSLKRGIVRRADARLSETLGQSQIAVPALREEMSLFISIRIKLIARLVFIPVTGSWLGRMGLHSDILSLRFLESYVASSTLVRLFQIELCLSL